MAVSYSINGNILCIVVEGVYSPEDIFDKFDRAVKDPRFPEKDAGMLLDVTRSESLAGRSVDDLRRVVRFYAARADRFGRRCAIVARSDVQFGLMRMAGVFAEEHNTEARVFKKRSEAELWLAHGNPVADGTTDPTLHDS